MATVTDAGMTRGSEGSLASWIKEGLIGGMVAGIVFAMFEMIMAALLNGASAFFMPLRMIGAMVLGQEALTPSYSLLGAAVTGVVVHMILSGMFGLGFGAGVAVLPTVARSQTMIVGLASIYGLLLWLINFYVIAPVAGWDWFPDKTNVTVQFFAHTFFFGAVLGFWLSRVRADHV